MAEGDRGLTQGVQSGDGGLGFPILTRMALSVGLEEGRRAFLDAVDRFTSAVAGLSEHDLLGASRCHGWTRLEVVSHVIAGWEEMLGGMVSRVQAPPSVDAATYWTAFVAESAEEDPVAVLMTQRRRAVAYARPSAAQAHLGDVAAAVRRGAAALPGHACTWQGHVFTAGDFLAVWAVEDAVHHLDLALDPALDPAPAEALALTRRTIEALVGAPLPSTWSDLTAALVGTGRLPVPDEGAALADRFPALR